MESFINDFYTERLDVLKDSYTIKKNQLKAFAMEIEERRAKEEQRLAAEMKKKAPKKQTIFKPREQE